MTDNTKRRGRPQSPGTAKEKRARYLANRRLTVTNISIPKDLRDDLNTYRVDLSEKLGIELTVAQALKYLIKNAEI